MPQGDLTIIDGFNPKGQVILASKNAANQFLKPRFFKIDEDKMAIEQGGNPQKGSFSTTVSGYDKTSWLGTPVFDLFKITPFSYVNEEGKTINIAADTDFETVLMEVTQTKNIITTAVQGRNGTVKEYISDGDYQISINGVITSKYNNVAPFESDANYVNQIIECMRANIAIPVSSNFLQMFNIHSIVVLDYKLNQIEGARNTIGFSMNCISDTPFEIKYNGVAKFLG